MDDIGSGRKMWEIVVRQIQHLEEMGDGWEAQAAVGKAEELERRRNVLGEWRDGEE